MKKFLLFLLLLIVMAVGFLVGQRGPDPTKWFVTPTPTPTCTATDTPIATATATGTPTSTFTPTSTPTPTPVPKKKKKAKKPAPPPKKPVLLPPPVQPPESKPICNAHSLPSAVNEAEPNNTIATAQSLGELTSQGLQVNGSLMTLANIKDAAQVEAFKIDPKIETADLDVDVYSFSPSTSFIVVLDCYSNVMGRPNPVFEENHYRLEVYDESFAMVGRSYYNDPIQAVEISASGKTFYVVVYGVFGKPSPYRLTITQKEAE